MLNMTVRPGRGLALVTVVVVLAVACGTTSNSTTGGSGASGGAADIAVAPANFDLAVGPPSRFLVGLFTGEKDNIGYGTLHLTFTYNGADGNASEPGPSADATFLVLPDSATRTPPEGPAKLDVEDGRGVYTATVGFDKPGIWQVAINTDIAGMGHRAATGSFQVLDHHQLPAVGDAAIASDNYTLTTPAIPPAAIDSRAGNTDNGAVPDADLHQTTIKQAVAEHRPAVVVFSTPVYCLSQFCGPVTDMVDRLARTYGKKADFIHIEIWKDYTNQKLNPTATEWIDKDGEGREPWVYVIGADGKIAARYDNVVTQSELEAALQRL